MNRTISKILILLTIILQSVTLSFAQVDFSVLDDILPGPDIELNIFVIDIINWMIGAASLVCVVMLISAGYTYMTAAGDEQKVQTAQKTITGALIGLVVSLCSVVLVNFVLGSFLGRPNV